MPRTDIADDVQFLPAVPGRLVVDYLARRLDGLHHRLAVALRGLAGGHLGLAPGFFLGGPLARFLVGLAPVLFFQPLAIEALAFEPLALLSFQRGLRLFLGLALPVDFFLLMSGLILEDLALHVGALAAHFDVDRTSTPLRARELQFRLRFAPQGD